MSEHSTRWLRGLKYLTAHSAKKKKKHNEDWSNTIRGTGKQKWRTSEKRGCSLCVPHRNTRRSVQRMRRKGQKTEPALWHLFNILRSFYCGHVQRCVHRSVFVSYCVINIEKPHNFVMFTRTIVMQPKVQWRAIHVTNKVSLISYYKD